MVSQLATDGEALRLFFTEDIYLVDDQIPSQREFSFLGKNRRNILILVNDGENSVSDETGRELLRKIVKSINLSADDFALLNYVSCKDASFEELEAYFDCRVVFAFGVSPAAIGLAPCPLNTIVQAGEVRLVFSALLPELNNDAGGKKALWGCLKNLNL
jgi:hypothetical protein